MSDSDHTAGPVVSGADPTTQEIFLPGGGGSSTATTVSEGAGEQAWQADAGDDEWPDRGPRNGIRMSVPTVVLLGLLIAAGGIWGGAALQRSHGTSSGTSSGASALASLFRSRGGATGFGGTGASALGGATTGTVTEVTGSTLYVTNASGALVKVTVGPSATVDRNAGTSLGSLQVGDTVVVEGTKASDGSVTATSISATAAGVTSPFAGFAPGATAGG